MDGKLVLLTQKWEELQASLGKMLVQTYVCTEEAQDLLLNPMVENRILEVSSAKVALVLINRKSALSWTGMVHLSAVQSHRDGKGQNLVKNAVYQLSTAM